MKNYLLPLSCFLIVLIQVTGLVWFFIWEKNVFNEQAANVQSAIKEYKNLEPLLESQRHGGYQLGGSGFSGMPTLYERINNELLVINNNHLTKLETAINRFNNSSTILSFTMIVLSIVMVLLVVFQIRLKELRDKQSHAPSDPMRFTY